MKLHLPGYKQQFHLCAEIIEYSDKNEIAVCNLASVCLSRFVREGKFDFD